MFMHNESYPDVLGFADYQNTIKIYVISQKPDK